MEHGRMSHQRRETKLGGDTRDIWGGASVGGGCGHQTGVGSGAGGGVAHQAGCGVAGFDDPEWGAEEVWGGEELERGLADEWCPPSGMELWYEGGGAGLVEAAGGCVEGEVVGCRASEGASEFTASKSFEGAVEGYVFKKGGRGVGYYVDKGPWVQGRLAGRAGGVEEELVGVGSCVEPVVIRLA